LHAFDNAVTFTNYSAFMSINKISDNYLDKNKGIKITYELASVMYKTR